MSTIAVIESRFPSVGQKLIGALCLTIFVATWLFSLSSPILLVVAIFYRIDSVALGIVLATVVAYLPWKRGWFSDKIADIVVHYTPLYYRSMDLRFEGKPLHEKQTLYAVHPHGAFCMGWSIMFCHPLLRSVRFCFAPALYASPFFRIFSRLTGNPGSASKASMISYLKKGESLALPPGGFEVSYKRSDYCFAAVISQ